MSERLYFINLGRLVQLNISVRTPIKSYILNGWKRIFSLQKADFSEGDLGWQRTV